MKKYSNVIILFLFIVFPIQSFANKSLTEGIVKLSYSDGKADTIGIENINQILKAVGIRVSTVALPKEALPILKASHNRSITSDEAKELISHFSLHRGELLNQISKAGRKPEAHRGGFLSTSEIGASPYPKVYDMKAITPEAMVYLQRKLGKLHVNSAENGVGLDEVMTVVSGGPWTWFFVLANNVVGKLTLGHVGIDSKAWRISYPGLGLHGAYVNSEYGLVVAYAHGPKNFVMRYEELSVTAAELLNTNPWRFFW